MTISRNDWDSYVKRLSRINLTAANKMREFLNANGYDNANAIIDYAYSLNSYYGEAAAALACEMYEAVALAQGVALTAIPAETLPLEYVANATTGILTTAPTTLPNVVARFVKQAEADTIIKNAKRDGVEIAWVPNGDTCPYCLNLASFGWRNVTTKQAESGRAKHIHNNCDCTYAVRFDGKSNVQNYDPQFYQKTLNDAEKNYDGVDKINALRREQYAENKDKINAQKREAYRLRKEIENEVD